MRRMRYESTATTRDHVAPCLVGCPHRSQEPRAAREATSFLMWGSRPKAESLPPCLAARRPLRGRGKLQFLRRRTERQTMFRSPIDSERSGRCKASLASSQRHAVVNGSGATFPAARGTDPPIFVAGPFARARHVTCDCRTGTLVPFEANPRIQRSLAPEGRDVC